MEFEIQAEDIFKEIKKLENMSKKLEKAQQKILNRLADAAIEVIRQNCPVDSGELINSIQKSEVFENTIYVFTDCIYAKYVEFGTGIRGKNNPHPSAAEFEWIYDYRGLGKTGQIGKQYMYKAFQCLEKEYLNIGEQVLKEEGLI